MKKNIICVFVLMFAPFAAVHAQIGKPGAKVEITEKNAKPAVSETEERKILNERLTATLTRYAAEDLKTLLQNELAGSEVFPAIEANLLERVAADKTISPNAAAAIKANISQLRTQMINSLLEFLLEKIAAPTKTGEYINSQYLEDASLAELRVVDQFLESPTGKILLESVKNSTIASSKAQNNLSRIEAEADVFAATNAGSRFLKFVLHDYREFVKNLTNLPQQGVGSEAVADWSETLLQPIVADYLNKYLKEN